VFLKKKALTSLIYIPVGIKISDFPSVFTPFTLEEHPHPHLGELYLQDG
jgi:hypothetical protein